VTDLATLTRIVSELAAKVEALSARIPARVGAARPSAVIIDVVQTGHGFTTSDVGKAVTCYGGGWALFTDYGESSYTPARPMWGIIAGITGANSFRMVIAGEGVTTSTTLEVGYWYTFQDGEPVKILGDYPPYEAAGAGIAAMAISATSVVVANDSRFQGLRSMDGTYAVVSHASIGVGHYVVWAGAPSGESPLALADPDNPWRWTNVGIALFEVNVAGTWLVLTQGNHEWHSYDNGDTRPGWMITPPYNAGQRIYLSESNPGQYATAEPAFKVYAGITSADYAPADPPSPEATTFVAKAVGQGVPYPIPASGGGTGTDVSALNEHSVLFVDTYGSPSSRKIAGLLSATVDYAVIAQKNSEFPVHLSLDLAATGSFLVDSGVLYARVCGKKTSTTAPSLVTEFLNWNGTEWAPYSLLTQLGRLLSHNGTTYVQVDASTPYSILGVAGGSNAVPAPVVAGAAGKLFQRGTGGLEFSDDPTLTRGGTDFKLCAVNTITASTTAPSASGVKGQMHFIY
jgi:hypothetical protein